jgi:VIT1/CCC1 family predicted Fe2+/Mn2+ transporter
MIPLSPYMLLAETRPALAASATLTGLALLVFGWLKARATGLPPFRGAVQAFAVGGLAATVAYVVAQWVDG